MKSLRALFLIFSLFLSGSVVGADSSLEYGLTRARQLQDAREYAASAKLLDRYIDNNISPTKTSDSLKMLQLISTQAKNFYYLGVTTRAADLYEQAIKLADAMGQKRMAAEFCNELFIIHLNSNNTQLSEDLLKRSLELYKQLGDKEGECKILNNIGILYYSLNELETSERYYEDALKLAMGDSAISATIYTNIAQNHITNGDFQTADRFLDKAIELNGRRYDTSDVLQAWLNKSEVQVKLGRNDRAREILRKVGANLNLRDPDRMEESLRQMARVYLQMGDSVASLRWDLRARQLADSLHTEQENDQVRELLVRYNSERIADHNKILELNVKRQKQWTYAMVIFIVLAVAFSVFLIHKIRIDKKKNKLIREQREQLMEFERKEHDRKEREFQMQLDRKNRELTSYSIDAASISELHKIIIDSLKRLGRSIKEAAIKKEISEDIGLLQNYNCNKVNEDFRVYFNEVNPEFMRTLAERFPELTSNDQRLCAYLYLGMSTKEIASLTFREIRSVESSRLRLRKKLGITGDISLHDFLHGL